MGMYKIAVVGKGMIGSAAARYLSLWSDGVALVGPDEPSGDWSQHAGVFASHYDQGRITRRLDPSLEWALWADRSIDRYAEIERDSGIPFHRPIGSILVCDPSSDPASSLQQIHANARKLGTPFDCYRSETYRNLRPEIEIEDGLVVLHEANGAGLINPRALVAAQTKLAQKQGAKIIREEVTKFERSGAGVTLSTNRGNTIQAEQVLIAAGGWTQFLTGIDLGLVPTPRTIVLGRLDSAEAARLRNMPTIIFYEGCEHPDASGFYILPPIEYPDGHSYIKIGADLPNILIPQTATELNRWFHGPGHPVEAASAEEILRRVIPNLRTEEIITKTCVSTHRPQALPLIGSIIDNKVLVAAAGAAKSSDEIGRLAAIQCMQKTEHIKDYDTQDHLLYLSN